MPKEAGPQRNSVSAWNSKALGSTLFLSAHYHDHRFQPHFHSEFAIGIIEDGCQAFTYDKRRRLDMSQGTVCLIAPGTVHEGRPGVESGWTYRMLYPSAELVDRAAADIFGSEKFDFKAPAVFDPDLYASMLHLHKSAASAHASELQVEAIFLIALRKAIERHADKRLEAPPRFNHRAMLHIRELLEDLYAQPISLTDLQNQTGMSKYHLLRQFKSAFGLPPHAYLNQVRIGRASAMILAGNGLADSAAAVGFADQAHMTHAFRRTLGYTPGVLAAAAISN